MAVDPKKYESVRDLLASVIDFAPISSKNKKQIENELFNRIIGDLGPLIDESRPPRLYIFGRSGVGKSSFINALANKHVADIGAVEPETIESEKYPIKFEGRYSNWDVVDSRGLFESVPADESVPGGTVDAVAADLQQYRPDIVVHMLTPDQARAGKQDFEVVEQLNEQVPGGLPPVIYCLNKVDTHLRPGGTWPPEENDALASQIVDNLDFVSTVLEQQERTPYDSAAPVRGTTFDSKDYIGVFPTYVKEEPYWNIETISELMCEYLPEQALLQFAQGQQRKSVMQSIARKRTITFSTAAAGIAGIDMSGVSDIMLLTPLQIYLVVLIGAFSCEELSLQLAKDYFAELGVVGGAGFGARKLAGTLIGMFPGAGQAINAGIAGAGTYAIGRSAEAYFFDDEFIKPGEFVSDGKDIFESSV